MIYKCSLRYVFLPWFWAAWCLLAWQFWTRYEPWLWWICEALMQKCCLIGQTDQPAIRLEQRCLFAIKLQAQSSAFKIIPYINNMTIRHAIELDTLTLLAISAVVGIVFAAYFNHKPNTRYSFSLPVMQAQDSTLSPVLRKLRSLRLKYRHFHKCLRTEQKNWPWLQLPIRRRQNLCLITSDAANANQQSIYEATLPNMEKYEYPFNTWSPDNAYVFLGRYSQ